MVTYFDEEMRTTAEPTEGQNLIKACLFNLVVYADSLERTVHCQDLVRLITEKYPCRILFIRLDESAQSDFLHVKHILQTVGTGASRVICDAIIIECSRNQLTTVPFLLLPNIVPDLPLYALFGQDPTPDRVILPQIEKFATRIIFDVEMIPNYNLFSEGLLAQMAHRVTDYVDVGWARTKAWREIMASVFASEERLQELAQTERLQITFSGRHAQMNPKAELQAIYLQAWIASAFGWELTSVKREDGCHAITYSHRGQPVNVVLIPKETEALDAGAIFSIEIMTRTEAHFLLSHTGKNKHIVVHASNPERCEMPYTIFLANYQRGAPLVSEIFYQPPSAHYARALRALQHPAWAVK